MKVKRTGGHSCSRSALRRWAAHRNTRDLAEDARVRVKTRSEKHRRNAMAAEVGSFVRLKS